MQRLTPRLVTLMVVMVLLLASLAPEADWTVKT